MLNVEDETPSSQSSFYESFLSNTSLFFKLFGLGGSCLKGYLAAFKTHSRKVKRITNMRPGRSLNNLLIDVLDERLLSGSLIPLT